MIDDCCLLANAKSILMLIQQVNSRATCIRVGFSAGRTLWESSNYTSAHTHGYLQAITLWAWHCFTQCRLNFIFHVSEAADALISSVQIFRFLLFCISAMKSGPVNQKKKHIEVNTVNTGWKLSSSLSPVLVVRFSRAPLATRTSMRSQSTFNQRLFKKKGDRVHTTNNFRRAAIRWRHLGWRVEHLWSVWSFCTASCKNTTMLISKLSQHCVVASVGQRMSEPDKVWFRTNFFFSTPSFMKCWMGLIGGFSKAKTVTRWEFMNSSDSEWRFSLRSSLRHF